MKPDAVLQYSNSLCQISACFPMKILPVYRTKDNAVVTPSLICQGVLAVRNPAVAEREAEVLAPAAEIEDLRNDGVLMHLSE